MRKTDIVKLLLVEKKIHFQDEASLYQEIKELKSSIKLLALHKLVNDGDRSLTATKLLISKNSKDRSKIYETLMEISSALSAKIVFLKGMPFSQKAYGSLNWTRFSGDIDVMVSSDKALAYLKYIHNHYDFEMNSTISSIRLKFNHVFGQHLCPAYINQTLIEVHHRMAYSFISSIYVNEHVDEILNNRVYYSYDGLEVPIMDDTDAIIFACIRMFLHQIYESVYDFKFITDIVYYLRNNHIALRDIYSRCKRYGCSEPVVYAFCVINEIFRSIGEGDFIDTDEMKKSLWPSETHSNTSQIRCRMARINDIVGYHSIPLIDRYFCDHNLLIRRMLDCMEKKYDCDPEELTRKRINELAALHNVDIGNGNSDIGFHF